MAAFEYRTSISENELAHLGEGTVAYVREMESDDLDMENFKSLEAMTAFVLQKNGHRHAAAIN